MTVVSFVFLSTARWAAFSRVPCQKNPGAGCLLAVDLRAAAGFAVGAQAAQRGDVAGVAVRRGGQRRVPGRDRDAAEGRAGRELGAPAGDRCRGCLGSRLAALRACFCDLPRAARAFRAALRALSRALRALALALRPCRGAVPAAAPGTGPRPRRPAPPRARTAGHRPGHDRSGQATRRIVFSDGATRIPARLCRGQPSALSTRCGRLAARSPAAVNESHPASLAAIEIAITHGRVNRTSRGSRGSCRRPSHCHSEAGAAGSGEST